MHLNCALVSSILFISAVLAGNHLENQQPPFLDRVEKSINTDEPLVFDWAGASSRARGSAIQSVTGTFTVPDAWKASNAAFDVVVGINGPVSNGEGCGEFIISGAINVMVTTDGTSYSASARGFGDNVRRASQNFVFAGDRIKITVNVETLTSGYVVIEHVETEPRPKFRADFSGRDMGCRPWEAVWAVAVLPEYIPYFPAFRPVDFSGIAVNGAAPDSYALRNILQPGSLPLTAIESYRTYVFIFRVY